MVAPLLRRLALLALVGLPLLGLLQGDSLAGPPKKDPPKPPTPTASAPRDPASLTDKEIAKALEPFTTAIASGDKNAAMDALLALLNDPAQSLYHGLAWARYADLLRTLDLPYAATLASGQAILLDPTHSVDQVKPALEAAAKLHDTSYLEEVFSTNVGLDVDAQTRGELAYLGARGAWYGGHYTTAIGILALVPKDSAHYAQAQALKGVAQSRLGKTSDAMATLVVAQALVADDPELVDLVNLNLGRTYFAAENWGRAVEYYRLVRRDSPWWPQAQFEQAWAFFRAEDINGTLSLLQTHTTPYFADWYFPEAQLLRIYSLFLICKFPEATRQVTAFSETWTPVRDELSRIAGGLDRTAAFNDVRSYVEGKDHVLPEMVLRNYPQDQRLLDAFQAVDLAEREVQRLEQRSEPWAKHAAEQVRARRQELIEREGAKVLDGVQAQVATLTGMLTDAELSKLDMMRLETQLYQQAAAAGELADIEQKARRDVRVRKGYVSWPYEGEIWADEIGYVQVNAIPECPQGLMRGTQQQ